MGDLKDRLRADLTTAIKARDEVRSSTLRMVLTAITNAEVAGKQARELTDEDVLGVLTSEGKKRREAAEAFDDAGRTEQAAKERAEFEVLADYLPEQLGDDEIAALVTEAIESTGARDEGMRAMGKVMGVLQPKVKGRADGGAVAAEVRRQLG
ncbi:GatB/YqeY domain-containing protein [Nocardioides pocheonensis]|uniref:GatB/YqeY domain-containing protein n=1 Tax=Nocardioides pocheonensis TaxID=661485 RepID=A0A3N0GQH3_9ACTN|nr:GatB/YqeY domain-containing protein [Nocardioides pocheonensis]RNM14649.1 GatB/YqeY domain-containing protein [Nocardioides pocheonensis]